jgi:hypothetical protein
MWKKRRLSSFTAFFLFLLLKSFFFFFFLAMCEDVWMHRRSHLKQLSKAIKKSPFRLEGDNNNGPWESEVVSGFLFLTTIQENPVRV